MKLVSSQENVKHILAHPSRVLACRGRLEWNSIPPHAPVHTYRIRELSDDEIGDAEGDDKENGRPAKRRKML